MITFRPLASGSKGNCIYLATPTTKILIDAGISARRINEELVALGTSVSEIQAILITHEHGDHIAGLKTLAFRYNIPVLANSETAKGIVAALGDCPRFKIFFTGEPFEFGDLEIHPFSIQHDTRDPVAFTIATNGFKIGICTDLGFVTNLVSYTLKDCHLLHIEANHEPTMVHASARPYIYKQRVLSRTGHLSNAACGELLCNVAHSQLRYVYLAHLSSECNSHDMALKVVGEALLQRGITLPLNIALQDSASLLAQLH